MNIPRVLLQLALGPLELTVHYRPLHACSCGKCPPTLGAALDSWPHAGAVLFLTLLVIEFSFAPICWWKGRCLHNAPPPTGEAPPPPLKLTGA